MITSKPGMGHASTMHSDPVEAVEAAIRARICAPGYQQCTRCVMDSSHAEISFDANGICNFCHGYDKIVRASSPDPATAKQHLERALDDIRARGRGRSYDCVLGISGGVDSSFLALRCKDWGIRPLLVQFDNGWNTELANNNIQALCECLNLDLHTHVVDWPEFRDLQLAFLRAGVANFEAPSDHGIFACIYRTALARRIPYLLSGVNNATESCCPIGESPRRTFSYGYRYDDLHHLKAIHKRFGKVDLKTFPTLGYTTRWFLERSKLVRRFDPLNFMPYIKASAVAELQSRTSWKPYPGKHFESVSTRFHQSYILPVKFGLDKRQLHLSGLIWSEQMSRTDALAELNQPTCPPELLRQDYQFFIKKMQLATSQFLEIMGTPPQPYTAYPNQLSWIHRLAAVSETIQGLIARKPRRG